MDSAQLQQRYESGERAFDHLDLSGIDLSGFDLRDADFSASDLYGAKLIDALLSAANFSGQTNLAYANLTGAELSGANFSGANLEGATLDEATTNGIIYDEHTTFPVGFNPVAASATKAQRNIAQRRLAQTPFLDPTEKLTEPSEPAFQSLAPQSPGSFTSSPQEVAPGSIPTDAKPGSTQAPGQNDTESKLSLSPSTAAAPPYSFDTEMRAASELTKEIESEFLVADAADKPTPAPLVPRRSNFSCLGGWLGLFFVMGGCVAIVSSGLMSLLESQSTANPFERATYPRSACGDPLPKRAKDFPTSLYPVYVRYSAENLDIVKRKFCQDAFVIRRRDTGSQAIQVASFVQEKRAQQFGTFLQQKVGSGIVGTPTRLLQIKEKAW